MFTTGINDAVLGPLIKDRKPGVHIVMDGPEDTDLVTIHRPYVLRDLPDSENEAKVQPTFVVTFGEGEIVPPWPVVRTLLVLSDETDAAFNALVTAYLDPANLRP